MFMLRPFQRMEGFFTNKFLFEKQGVQREKAKHENFRGQDRKEGGFEEQVKKSAQVD